MEIKWLTDHYILKWDSSKAVRYEDVVFLHVTHETVMTRLAEQISSASKHVKLFEESF